MNDKIIFYRLSAKFLDQSAKIPNSAKDVMYYSLAIGHHVGIVDCFKPALSCSKETYENILTHLPPSKGKDKLNGLLKFGEITVDITHTRLLKSALASATPSDDSEVTHWLAEFGQLLDAIDCEPALYLMGRER